MDEVLTGRDGWVMTKAAFEDGQAVTLELEEGGTDTRE
jgi:hypothetical protein